MKLDLDKHMELGAKIAVEQDMLLARRALDEGATDRAKAKLRAALARRPLPKRAAPFSKRLLFAIAATFVVGLLFSVNVWRRHTAPLAFQVDGQAAQRGAWLGAPSDRALDLRFSDASEISLSPSARARVVDVDANGARVLLESGSAHVSITHRDGSRWHVMAGPFDVLVTGTEFDVAWDPANEELRVHMQHGTVHVTGASLGEGLALSTGETLDVSVRDGVVRQPEAHAGLDGQLPRSEMPAREDTHEMPENKPVSASETGSTAHGSPQRTSAPADQPEDLSSQAIAPQKASPPETSRVPGPPPLWATLAASGEYARAIQNAEDTGFDRACAEGRRSDVLALGDAARLRGRDDDARVAYDAVRSRGKGDDLAAEAAFGLGRLAFDRAHDYAAAAKWFATYGNENPSGKLAREAAGSLIESRQRSGDLAGARDAAKDYLARFPDGPRADLARSLIAEAQTTP